jgi:hypothetical protein
LCITATGVFVDKPPATNCLEIFPILDNPIMTTIVSTELASFFQFTGDLIFPGSSWPVTNAIDDEYFL